MSRLAIYQDNAAGEVQRFSAHRDIAAQLAQIGVRFEQWEANRALSPEATQDEILEAYSDSVERLTAEYGFKSVDVVSLRPDHPQKDEMRAKFLSEHVHDDFEVRFFVDGSGLFYLHVGDRVYIVLCEQGDLISVPAGVPHWFDMGANPDFKCIRLFVVPDGWVAQFSGSDVAFKFPDYDSFVAERA